MSKSSRSMKQEYRRVKGRILGTAFHSKPLAGRSKGKQHRKGQRKTRISKQIGLF